MNNKATTYKNASNQWQNTSISKYYLQLGPDGKAKNASSIESVPCIRHILCNGWFINSETS